MVVVVVAITIPPSQPRSTTVAVDAPERALEAHREMSVLILQTASLLISSTYRKRHSGQPASLDLHSFCRRELEQSYGALLYSRSQGIRQAVGESLLLRSLLYGLLVCPFPQ